MAQLIGAPEASQGAFAPGDPRARRRRGPGGGAGRGAGRASAPVLRPAPTCAAPSPATPEVGGVRACVLPAPASARQTGPAASTDSWRLTERGVAVVLVIALMIMVAAAMVITLTAVTVTGEGYRPSVSAALPT